MARIVKAAGKNSRQMGRPTMHGSRVERRLMELNGFIARNDEKPHGFLSRALTRPTNKGR